MSHMVVMSLSSISLDQKKNLNSILQLMVLEDPVEALLNTSIKDISKNENRLISSCLLIPNKQ